MSLFHQNAAQVFCFVFFYHFDNFFFSKATLCCENMSQCGHGFTLHQPAPPHCDCSVCVDTGMPGFEEFVCMDSVDCVTDGSPLYGVDCEMVNGS